MKDSCPAVWCAEGFFIPRDGLRRFALPQHQRMKTCQIQVGIQGEGVQKLPICICWYFHEKPMVNSPLII